MDALEAAAAVPLQLLIGLFQALQVLVFGVAVNANQRGRRDLEHFLGIGGYRGVRIPLPATVADLTVAALNAFAPVDAHIDGDAKLDVRGVGELERSELGAHVVAVDRLEVLEQKRVHRAAANVQKSKHFRYNVSRTQSGEYSAAYPLKMMVSSCDLVSVTSI